MIVGRCADYVLRDRPDVLKVFLHATMDFRKKFALAAGDFAPGTEDRVMELSIQKEDKRRASYYNYYTQNRWGEAQYYDMCLNAALGIDACAELIEKAAQLEG